MNKNVNNTNASVNGNPATKHWETERSAAKAKATAQLAEHGWLEETTDPARWSELLLLAESDQQLDGHQEEWVDGNPPEKLLAHFIRMPSKPAAEAFVAAGHAMRLDFEVKALEEVVGAVDAYSVVMTRRTLMTAGAVTPFISTLWFLAWTNGGAYESWDIDEGSTPPVLGKGFPTRLATLHKSRAPVSPAPAAPASRARH